MTVHNNGFTPRERAIVDMLCQGKTRAEIIAALGISGASYWQTTHNIKIKFRVAREVSLNQYFGENCNEEVMIMK